MNDPTQRFLNDPMQRFINSGFIAEPQIANTWPHGCVLTPSAR
jgi:hypothetical protein